MVVPINSMNDNNNLTDFGRQWMATLGGLQDLPQANYEFRFSLMRLNSWPCLTHLPADIIPAVARICALLARKPTTTSLIPLALGLTEEVVYPLIETMRLNNHLQIVGGTGAASSSASQETSQPAYVDDVKPAENSLIAKIWQRLGLGS